MITLETGSAGYIGQHAVAKLVDANTNYDLIKFNCLPAYN
jgi:nucleoside-diphosphate-sugar epimerase